MYYPNQEEQQMEQLNQISDQIDSEGQERLSKMKVEDWEKLHRDLKFLFYLKDRNWSYLPSQSEIESGTTGKDLMELLADKMYGAALKPKAEELPAGDIKPEDLPF